jgi:hypothetical protein
MINNNTKFNTYLNDFKTDMVNMINNSGLPVGVVYYIVKDLFSDIQLAYENTLKKEKEEIIAEQKANKKISKINESEIIDDDDIK